jgi:hypothetical protein
LIAASGSLAGQWYSVWKWLGILVLEMGAVGFLFGSTYCGLNMLLTCRWLRMNRNYAFSALRIGHYNNFLRPALKATKSKFTLSASRMCRSATTGTTIESTSLAILTSRDGCLRSPFRSTSSKNS